MARHGANRFSIARQLRYSREKSKRALDLCAFINGLPVATFELKNSLIKQTVEDAMEQYKRETIEKSFADYYRTTILSKETDPNKLHTLKGKLDGYQVYAPEQVNELVALYLGGADRDRLDPILDACVAVYMQDLDEAGRWISRARPKPLPAPMTSDFPGTIRRRNNPSNKSP